MASLRARVLAGVLLLSATGLLALAALTYVDQRSFLENRINQEARATVGAVSQELDAAGVYPQGTSVPPARLPARAPRGRSGSSVQSAGRAGAPPRISLPWGTYGQRREASGRVVGAAFFSYTTSEPARPLIPAHVPVEKLFTVGSVGSSGLRYRAYMSRDPEDPALTLVAIPLTEVDQTLSRLLLVEGLVILGVLLALGVSAWFVVRLGLRPLDRMEVTAGEIATGELGRRVSPASSKTEVGRLGLALNAMLDRLEQAFAARIASEERLRQFLADASHELRTPLASIRGYAELFRMGAAEDRADTELAMRRIEEEAKRMGVLVEDLLTLARLDEAPSRNHERVDLCVLARDAVEDARATSPEREIELGAPEGAFVWGDSHQLRQVLANLTRNALVHTPRGTPIEVSVAQDQRSVCLRVRDHGPGLRAADRENLFERFWRAEGGRTRGRAGAGLGLAIARAIVDAHHGEITAADPPGGGAEFVVRLPRHAPSPGREGTQAAAQVTSS